MSLLPVLVAQLAAGCATAPTARTSEAARPAGAPPRVIFIVGDGTGLAYWSAALLAGEEPLAVSALPEIGLVDTRCDCRRTTDSGAAATAYAIGARTGYTMIGMTADSVPRVTVLEAAEAAGMATGLVTTTHVTDATPAAFSAHVASRYDRYGIAAQMVTQDIEVMLGGGRHFFTTRTDGRDLVRELAERYTVVTTPAEFEALEPARVAHLLGLFADSTIYPNRQLRPSLPAMARVALAILDRDPDGFFLLLESEDTDDLGHDNRPVDELIAGMRELDQAIAVALDYQRRQPGTLVVVTGDHESGGLALRLERSGALTGAYTTTGHTVTMVPVFAGGPGAAAFGRWLTNAEVGQLLFRAIDSEARPTATHQP